MFNNKGKVNWGPDNFLSRDASWSEGQWTHVVAPKFVFGQYPIRDATIPSRYKPDLNFSALERSALDSLLSSLKSSYHHLSALTFYPPSASAMSASDAKKAEIARLFDLFERLASRRPRAIQGDNDAAMGDGTLNIPDELNPILQKLSTIVSARDTSTRPRRNTVASTLSPTSNNMRVSDDSSEDDDEESLANFPLADKKKYPFTFRLMVHKLYKKDDWARTIKEMLEKSKNEFMPLAEKAVVQAKQKEQENQLLRESNGTGIRFKVVPVGAGGKRGSTVSGVRRRSYSVAGVGSKSYVAISPLTKSPGAEERQEVRALKKRCIGRRKSMGGPLNANAEVTTGTNKSRGTWVYNATVSSAERSVPTTFSTFPPAPPPSPTETTRFSGYQPLGMMLPSHLQEKRYGTKRGVSAGDPTMMAPMMMMPPRSTKNTDPSRSVARKRATTVNEKDGKYDSERKLMKRPFAE